MIRILLVLVVFSTTASAAPPGDPEPVPEVVVHVRPPKSESTATALTLAGIVAPFALTYLTYEPNTDNPMYAPIGAITGVILPAMGHWYSGKIGGYGMLMRLGGFTLAMVGWSYLDDAARCDRGEQVPDGCLASDRTIGRVSIGLGVAAWAGSWIYDVASARREVRRHNQRTTVHLGPMLARGTTGLSLGGSF